MGKIIYATCPTCDKVVAAMSPGDGPSDKEARKFVSDLMKEGDDIYTSKDGKWPGFSKERCTCKDEPTNASKNQLNLL